MRYLGYEIRPLHLAMPTMCRHVRAFKVEDKIHKLMK